MKPENPAKLRRYIEYLEKELKKLQAQSNHERGKHIEIVQDMEIRWKKALNRAHRLQLENNSLRKVRPFKLDK